MRPVGPSRSTSAQSALNDVSPVQRLLKTVGVAVSPYLDGLSRDIGRKTGSEPPLTTDARVGLLSIAHNALTNAFRHAHAARVEVRLNFEPERILLSAADDGTGLPDGYAEQGSGFGGMIAAAQRMGGELTVETDRPEGGAAVICEILYRHAGEGK